MRAFLALCLVVAVSWSNAAPAQERTVEKLEDLKSKLRGLNEVLDHLSKKIDSIEAEEKKREFVDVPEEVDNPDKDTQDFINGLSPEDQELLKKVKSKIKFLQATVHEEPGVDIPAEDGFSEEQPAKREMDSEMAQLMGSMSEEDKELLKNHPSAWSSFEKAMNAPKGDNDADQTVEKREYEDELQEFVNELSSDDKELLIRMKAKLDKLKSEIKKDQGWHNTAVKCEGADCDKQPDVPEATKNVEQRLLTDLQYAKANGVSLKNVLRTLIASKQKA